MFFIKNGMKFKSWMSEKLNKVFSEEMVNLITNSYNYIVGLISGFLISLDLDVEVTRVLVIMMLIDTLVGGFKYAYLKETKFNLKKMLLGLTVKCIIITIPMVLSLVSMVIIGNSMLSVLPKTFIIIMLLNETLSFLTNCVSIKERKNIKNEDLISKFINLIRKLLREYYDKLVKKF